MTKAHTKFGVAKDFFQAPTEASRRKLSILDKYFDSYMRVMTAKGKEAGYADFFAGPGIYENGTKSAPVLICERVIADAHLRKHVRLWFNEADPELHSLLAKNIAATPNIDSLVYRPAITGHKITSAMGPRLIKGKVPTFVFADPCGYKGLSLPMISSFVKPYGNDCLFFFNYSRVNMKLGYPVMDDSINEFFGPTVAQSLREEIQNLQPAKREEQVLGKIQSSLKAAGLYSQTFRFGTRSGGGTSHHLVFATKNIKALGIIKSIFGSQSSDVRDGVGSGQFDPREQIQPTLFPPSLDEISNRLLHQFAGVTITFQELLKRKADSNFTDANYRDALLRFRAGTTDRNGAIR